MSLHLLHNATDILQKQGAIDPGSFAAMQQSRLLTPSKWIPNNPLAGMMMLGTATGGLGNYLLGDGTKKDAILGATVGGAATAAAIKMGLLNPMGAGLTAVAKVAPAAAKVAPEAAKAAPAIAKAVSPPAILLPTQDINTIGRLSNQIANKNEAINLIKAIGEQRATTQSALRAAKLAQGRYYGMLSSNGPTFSAAGLPAKTRFAKMLGSLPGFRRFGLMRGIA